MSPKYSKLNKALPFSGVKVYILPFMPIIMNAPRIIKTIDIKRTVIVIICKGLVFEMLLKENDAPEIKKRQSQNSKVPKTGTPSKSLERVPPVIIHFDIETPKRYIAIVNAGKNLQGSPYNTLNCST
jgi:hypothetical protein